MPVSCKCLFVESVTHSAVRHARGLVRATGKLSMRNVFKLSLLAAALSGSGCSYVQKPVEVGTLEPQSQYDDKMQDALGNQKITEAQMLYQRRLNGFQKDIDDIEYKRKNLDAALNARAYESGLAEAPASDSEAGRISEYQSAARASQARVAEEASKLTLQQSLIENRRDKDLLEAERKAAKEIGEVEIQAAKDLAAAEDRINQDIEGRRSIDSAVRMKENQRFDEQRFTLALANAESERQANQKLVDETALLSRLKTESEARVAGQELRVVELRRQIAEIEAQIVQIRSQDAVALASQQTKVNGAQAEAVRLADISAKLKSAVSSASGIAGPQNSEYVQAKELELSRARGQLEITKSQRIAQINSILAQEKNSIVARARTEIASSTASTEMSKAGITAPVLTGRAVYSGENAAKAAVATPPAGPSKVLTPALPRVTKSSPVLVINRFEPKVDEAKSAVTNESIGGSIIAGGSGLTPPGPPVASAPLVIAPKSRSVYEVFYVYKDEGSWKKFQEFLRAYGINDFIAEHSNKSGEFFIYCGRYYDDEQAASRVTYLNKTTATKNVQVKQSQVPL